MDFIISSQEWDYSESDIARNSDVSIRTVQRELSKLLESKLIKLVRTVGNAKMYQLEKSYRTGYVLEKLALSLAQQNIRKMTKGDVKTTTEELEKTPLVEEVLLSSDIEPEPSEDLDEIVDEDQVDDPGSNHMNMAVII
jgi:DNA-binding transcriptional ArsR family regulator